MMKAKKSADARMIFVYRYASLAVTSLAYVFGDSGHDANRKWLLIILLFMIVSTFTYIYRRYQDHPKIMMFTIALETVGIIALLFPTGGAGSPFKWYIINPMVTAGVYLSTIYSWILLTSYIGIQLTFCYTFFNKLQTRFFPDVLIQNMNLILVLSITMMAMQMIGTMKRELTQANTRVHETMEHIRSIYHIMETASRNEAMNMGQVISDYTVKLTGQQKAFFWLDHMEEDAPASSQTGWSVEEEEGLFAEINHHREQYRSEREPFFKTLPDWGEFLMITVPMTTRFVAIIGVKLEPEQELSRRRWLVQQLIFLAELSAVFLERYELERIESQLIITNEQNRIANEMHDNVSQSLFGMVYSTHSLRQTWHKLPRAKVNDQLDLLQESANQAARELKLAIHSLSSRKGGAPTWMATVKSHLHMLSRLNEVQIELSITGDHHTLPYLYQKMLYRVISESAGNAIRHGLANHINVSLVIHPQRVKLVITDDGIGFEADKITAGGEALQPEGGLGLGNMEYLAKSMGGEFNVTSGIGSGTELVLSIPVQLSS